MDDISNESDILQIVKFRGLLNWNPLQVDIPSEIEKDLSKSNLDKKKKEHYYFHQKHKYETNTIHI